jgi:hypothetical protein
MSRIADLLLEQGRIAAEQRARSGALWGNLVSNLGQIPGQYLTNRREQQLAAGQAREAALDREARRQLQARQEARAVAEEERQRAAEGRAQEAFTTSQAAARTTAATAEGKLAAERRTQAGLEARDLAKTGYQPSAVLSWLGRRTQEGFWDPAVGEALQARANTPEGLREAIDFVKQWAPAEPLPPKVPTREIALENPDGTKTIQIVEDKPGQSFTSTAAQPKPGTFEDFLRVYARDTAKVPLRDLNAQQYAGARKLWESLNDSPSSGAGGAAGGGAYTAEGLDYAATRARLTGQYPGRNAGVNAAIDNEIAKQNRALGNSPAAAIQRQAGFSADSKSLTKMTQMKSAADAFEQKAIGQIPIIEELSAKVNRTRFPIINTAIISGKKELLGDSDTSQLTNAIETFTEEYAKIMNGSTGSAAAATDSARAAAKRLIDAKMNKGTMTDVLALMRREMSLTMQGYDATINHINERMGAASAPAPGSTAAPAGAPPPAAAGAGPRRVRYDINGNPIP